ncbi:MAG TPA: hypothetical protein VKI65_20405 [Gemmataceae bacterium]|nr:hypothetical protein [Gemmataceae bacterium]
MIDSLTANSSNSADRLPAPLFVGSKAYSEWVELERQVDEENEHGRAAVGSHSASQPGAQGVAEWLTEWLTDAEKETLSRLPHKSGRKMLQPTAFSILTLFRPPEGAAEKRQVFDTSPVTAWHSVGGSVSSGKSCVYAKASACS